jgi:hypothetical protein
MKTRLIIAITILLAILCLNTTQAQNLEYQVSWMSSRTLFAADSPSDIRIVDIVAKPYAVSWQHVDTGNIDINGENIYATKINTQPAIVISVAYETNAYGEDWPCDTHVIQFPLTPDNFTSDQLNAIENTRNLVARRALANNLIKIQTTPKTKSISVTRCEYSCYDDTSYYSSCPIDEPCPKVTVEAKYLILQIQKRDGSEVIDAQ